MWLRGEGFICPVSLRRMDDRIFLHPDLRCDLHWCPTGGAHFAARNGAPIATLGCVATSALGFDCRWRTVDTHESRPGSGLPGGRGVAGLAGSGLGRRHPRVVPRRRRDRHGPLAAVAVVAGRESAGNVRADMDAGEAACAQTDLCGPLSRSGHGLPWLGYRVSLDRMGLRRYGFRSGCMDRAGGSDSRGAAA